ncbi:MAG: PorT family protein [Prevotella sp.]|nr:PorT family protein [Prevotella sp.]
MKKKILIIFLVCAAQGAMAQVNFGVKGGINVSHFTVKESVISSNNRTGFYFGPTMRAMIPHTGAGFDLSVLFDQRQGGVFIGAGDEGLQFDNKGRLIREEKMVHQRQIVVPLNLRYELGSGDVVSFVLFAGPQLGVNVGKDVSELDWRWKTADLSVNMGLGVVLLDHLQINANYNLACGRVSDFRKPNTSDGDNGKFNAWQVGLAYYF